VLLGQNLAVLDQLHRGVVVVLVHLAVDGCLQLITLGPDHLLVLHSRLDDLCLESSQLGQTPLESIVLTSCTVVSCLPFLERKLESDSLALFMLAVGDIS
jgi:hypothetical protein